MIACPTHCENCGRELDWKGPEDGYGALCTCEWSYVFRLHPRRELNVYDAQTLLVHGTKSVLADTYVPVDKKGWWGGPDTRTRCSRDGKVVFKDSETADLSASRARREGNAGGAHLRPYLDRYCGHWHLSPWGNQPSIGKTGSRKVRSI